MYVKKDGVPKYYSNEQRKAAHASMAEKKDGITKHKGFPKYKDGMMKMTPKQKAVAGGMPMEVANKIGIPKKGSNEPMMNYSSFKSYNIKAGGSKNTSFKMRAGSDGPMAKNYGPMLNASEITYEQAKFNASSPATQNLIKAGAPPEVIKNSKNNDVKKFKEKNGLPKTYDQAYDGLSAEKKAEYRKKGGGKEGSGRSTFKTEAKDYNTRKYGTTEPTKYAKGTGRTKEKLASDNKKNVEVKKKEQVKKATVKEKKTPIGPKERTTVKKAKATKKAGVKEAKQKGYETRKDRRAAVSDARKAGRAGVKEARKDKKDLKKAEKNTRKRDKKEVKGAITDAKRAAKIDKLKSKKSTNKRSNKIDDLQAKRKLNSDEPLARYKK